MAIYNKAREVSHGLCKFSAHQRLLPREGNCHRNCGVGIHRFHVSNFEFLGAKVKCFFTHLCLQYLQLFLSPHKFNFVNANIIGITMLNS